MEAPPSETFPSLDEDKLREEYRHLQPLYQSLCDEVCYILKMRIEELGLKIHIIESRVKQFPSLLQKAKRAESKAPFDELHDIAGIRIVCLFRDDLARLDEVIKANFRTISVDDKLQDYASSLGYQSIHYVCELGEGERGARYDRLKGLRFEIQVRTLCMHCWAAVSHYIDYKGDWDVPNELKQSLNALSGLFYVADSQFQQFSEARRHSKESAEQNVSHDRNVQAEINLDTLSAYLKKTFPERRQNDSNTVSELVQDAKRAGYTSIAEIDRDVRRASTAFIEYERASPPLSGRVKGTMGKYAAVGVVRSSLCIASEKFEQDYNEKFKITSTAGKRFRHLLVEDQLVPDSTQENSAE